MNKEKLIEEYLAKPYEVGEKVYVRGLGSQNKNAFNNSTELLSVDLEEGLATYKEHGSLKEVKFEDLKKVTYNLGYNPMNKSGRDNVSNVNFSLHSVLFKLGLIDIDDRSEYKTKKGFLIKQINFNPFVETGAMKKFYQRPLVWDLETKQNLLESIYNNIDCGKILIRERGWDWLHSRELEEECYWYDVVDGKQRLSAIHEFINNGYPDLNGFYWRDFSGNAQHKLLDHQLFSYSEMNPSVTDEEVLTQFLKLNFAGIPQSIEHINFVKGLLVTH